MALCPPSVRLPRGWWILAGVFLLSACAVFLPVDGFGLPEWRRNLESLGVDVGSMVVIQSRQAAEMLALFACMLIGGLWLAGHRASQGQLRRWAMAFTVGVACYALASKWIQNAPHAGGGAGQGVFGFFPNRNHTATYLAMGSICGLGCTVQALRDKRFLSMSLGLLATGICLWAVAAWSVSRAGVVLVAIGCVIWLPILGRRYLGRHGLWAVGLMALTGIGLFFIADSKVKQRLTETVEKAGTVIAPQDSSAAGGAKSAMEFSEDLDFRIPTALDTFDLIEDFKWTGIGAGQYFYIFPQYKNRTAIANDSDSYHPESDWLWMAAETGIPATLALLALVILAFRKSQLAILRGSDRALRSACWVAALLVPVHGCFDVPGHRITLAWSAAFLFALSMHAPSGDRAPTPPRTWPFRVTSLILLAAAAFLIRAQWFNGPEPAVTTAGTAVAMAKRLYQEDRVLQQAAVTEGREYQPDPSEDKLEQALQIISPAKSLAPLDRDLLRYESFLALHFDDKFDLIDHSNAIERALDPTWVNAPMRQAEAWSKVDPQRSAVIWTEALRRASELEQLHPEKRGEVERTKRKIHQFAKGKPGLEALIPAMGFE